MIREDLFVLSKYRVLTSAIAREEAEFLRDYILSKVQRGKVHRGDALVPGAPAAYGDVVFDGLLEKIVPLVEDSVGCSVFPTYSYFRLYRRGDYLPCHRDRPACEFSLSVSLGSDPDQPWPLWIEVESKPVAVSLEVGSALLYRGTEVSHWREEFKGNYAAQVFLHYVDQKGPHAEWKFDKRTTLGVPATHV